MHVKLVFGEHYDRVLVAERDDDLSLPGSDQHVEAWVPLDPAPSLRVFNHSPDGFAWGYGGSGPAQLALALLLHTGIADDEAVRHQQFKFDHVAKWPQSSCTVEVDVDGWAASWRSLHTPSIDEQPTDRITGTAESLEVESEEDGFHLVATTSDGDTIDLRIHAVAFEFSSSKGLLALLEWSAEGHSVKAQAERSMESAAAGGDLETGYADDPGGDLDDNDDDSGYDLDDPKHPTYHDRMSDVHDNREGK